MRFLADESCDYAVVRALRASGHDVVAVREVCPGAEDEAVADMAIGQGRILITEDKDFGRLVFSRPLGASSVVFIRFPARARKTLATTVVKTVEVLGGRMEGRFVVVRPGRVRILERRQNG